VPGIVFMINLAELRFVLQDSASARIAVRWSKSGRTDG
jgi:hypothetical protein